MSAGHAARKARSAAFGAALLAAASVPAPAQVRLESATLGASDGVAGDRFGAALAADGERVVVGAPRAAGAGSGGGTGAAYVYRWNGSVWVEEAELVPSDGLANDEFGGAVAVSGERVLVGALRHSANGSSAGAAYLYELQGATWVETKLLASNGTTFDRFGTSVALDGDLAVVGAPFHVGQGKAYVFGPEITFRSQPHGTFKFLFNGIYLGAKGAGTVTSTASK